MGNEHLQAMAKRTRKSSVGGYMLTDEELTRLIEKSTVLPSEKKHGKVSQDGKDGNGSK